MSDINWLVLIRCPTCDIKGDLYKSGASLYSCNKVSHVSLMERENSLWDRLGSLHSIRLRLFCLTFGAEKHTE